MRVGDKVKIMRYLRDEKRKVIIENVTGTIVSPVRYTDKGIHWHWCVYEKAE